MAYYDVFILFDTFYKTIGIPKGYKIFDVWIKNTIFVTNNETDTLEAKVLTISKKGLLLSIPAGDFYLPFDLYPWFEKAKIKDVFDVKMEGDDAVRWEALDVDLEVEGLLNPEKYPLIAK